MDCISKRLDPFGTIFRSHSPGLIVMALSSRPLNLNGWRLLLLAGVSRKFGSPPTSPCARYTPVAPKSVFFSLRKLTSSDRPTERLVALNFQCHDKSRHLQRSRRPFSRAPRNFFRSPEISRVSELPMRYARLPEVRAYTKLIAKDRTRYHLPQSSTPHSLRQCRQSIVF